MDMGVTMTHLLSLLADCERWLGIEPLGEEQWAEVAELRERVRAARSPSCRECMGSGVVTKGIGLPGALGIGHCDCVPAENRTPENEPFSKLAEPLCTTRDLRSVSAEFLAEIARKREKEDGA
jgi:hypothetical protein